MSSTNVMAANSGIAPSEMPVQEQSEKVHHRRGQSTVEGRSPLRRSYTHFLAQHPAVQTAADTFEPAAARDKGGSTASRPAKLT